MKALKRRLLMFVTLYARRLKLHRIAVWVGAAAARRAPRDWRAYYRLGRSLRSLGRMQEAVHAFSEAFACRPEDTKTERFLADVLVRTGRPADAIDAEVLAKGGDPLLFRRLCIALFHNDALDLAVESRMEEVAGMRARPMVSVRDWAARAGQAILEAGEREEIVQMTPPVLGPEGLMPAAARVDSVQSNKPYVAELRNGVIFSKSDTVLAEDGTVLNDLPSHPDFGPFADLRSDPLVVAQRPGCFLIALPRAQPVVHPGGIFLGGTASGEFGHWVQELLMKLQFFEQHPDFARLPIIVDQAMPQSHFDYLKCIVRNELVMLPGKSAFLCRRLLVSPTPTFHPLHILRNDLPRTEIGALSPAGLRFLQARVLENLKVGRPQRGRKLYLSRRNMRWRQVINDAEIAEFLVERGFEVIEIEQYSFADQVKLFREAECIVAPEGSALLNVIFCDPSVRLYILAQRDFWYGYHGPLKALGYRQLWIIGDTEFQSKQASYSIPVERIQRALEGPYPAA
jgi:hypothetical protein